MTTSGKELAVRKLFEDGIEPDNKKRFEDSGQSGGASHEADSILPKPKTRFRTGLSADCPHQSGFKRIDFTLPLATDIGRGETDRNKRKKNFYGSSPDAKTSKSLGQKPTAHHYGKTSFAIGFSSLDRKMG